MNTLLVSNREEAYMRVCIVIGLSFGLCFFLFLVTFYSLFITSFFVVFLLCLPFFIKYIKSQNLRKVIVENGFILVKYQKKGKDIVIPVNSIIAIQRGIGGINFSGKMSICYTISFNEKYPFGKKYI